MPSRVSCFYIEPGDTAAESYRRFASGPCSGPLGYHDAEVVIATVPWNEPYHGCGMIPSEELKADLRWPQACVCGYCFRVEDTWQHNMARHFVDKASGAKYTLRDAPPGAMWNADWMFHHGRTTADGIWLCVRLPNGDDWLIDGPSSNGPGWTRTGVLPKVTARPSIFSRAGKPNAYHGWLTDGELVEC